MINKTLSKYATHDNSAYPGLWRGCVGAWCPSLGPSGSRLFDYSGRQNWGTLTNMDPATDWVVDEGAYALDFDGSNDFVVIDTWPQMNLSQSITISAWSKTSGLSGVGDCIFGQLNTTGSQCSVQFYARGSSNFPVLSKSSNGAVGTIESVAGVTALGTKWTHVCATFDNATKLARFFIDGAINAETTMTNAGIFVGTSPMYMGARQITSGTIDDHYGGLLDDLRMYNRAIHPNECRLLARRRGIAFTPRTRRLAPSKQAAGGATPWLYARRQSRIIGGGVS